MLRPDKLELSTKFCFAKFGEGPQDQIFFENMAQAKKFLQEVKGELKKVSWSKRQELFDSTVAVIVATVLLGIFIGVVDFFFSQMIRIFIQ